jgi:hypothetical protein
VKTADEMSMTMKTTQSVLLPSSSANWYSGLSGSTVGSDEAVAEAVGRSAAVVVFLSISTGSIIMMAVDGGRNWVMGRGMKRRFVTTRQQDVFKKVWS